MKAKSSDASSDVDADMQQCELAKS